MEYKESPQGIAKWDCSGLCVRIHADAPLETYHNGEEARNPARVGRILFESNTSKHLFVKYPDSNGTYHDPADLEIISEIEYRARINLARYADSIIFSYTLSLKRYE